MTKDDFLKEYNPNRTVETALSESIGAAVKRNKIYLDVNLKDRKEIRKHWQNLLIQLYERFVNEKWDESIYEDEIIKLKDNMNNKFNDSIDFRISHSQKSISVFFKHLWCLDKISTPPQCPVDRIILTRAKAPYNERSWGLVNDIQTHRYKYNLIRQAAIKEGFDDVLKWELENFKE